MESITIKALIKFEHLGAKIIMYASKQTKQAPMLFALAIFFIILLWGCGYKSKPDLLRHIDSFTLSPIANDSSEYGLDVDFTNAFKQEFSRHWTEGSDSIFTVSIKDYRRELRGITPNGQPEQYRLTITLSFVFDDRKRSKTIKREDKYEKFYDFYVVTGRGKPPETFEEAKKNLVKVTVEDIVSSIVEEW